MKRISILGSGWLGLPLAIELNHLGYQVKSSSRSESRLSQLRHADISAHVYDIEVDVNDPSFLQADILIVNITSKNIEAFQSLISKIEQTSISKVLFISSTSVYQDSSDLEQQPISETNLDALRPCPLLIIEKLFQDSTHFETSIIRFAGLIGYQRHPGRFFAQTQEDGSIKCKPIKNPDAAVNMIHRDDCIGIIKSLIQQNHWGEVFNACASDHSSRRDFYTQSVKNYSGGILIIMNFVESNSQNYKIIANDKVKNLLSYNFQHDDFSKINYEPTVMK
jgi:nucleoside-diphosphate-sugar epimerase